MDAFKAGSWARIQYRFDGRIGPPIEPQRWINTIMERFAKRAAKTLAIGTLVLATAVSLSAGVQAKSLNRGHGNDKSYNEKSASHSHTPSFQHRGTTTTSFVQVVKRGHWRIMQQVTLVKYANGKVKHRSVSVLKRKWIG